MENDLNMSLEEKLQYELMLKYCKRFREIYNDLISNGYFGVLIKHEVLDVVIKEFLNENPDVDKKIMCKIFFVIGDISNMLKHSKSNFDKTRNLDMRFDPTSVKINEIWTDNDKK